MLFKLFLACARFSCPLSTMLWLPHILFASTYWRRTNNIGFAGQFFHAFLGLRFPWRKTDFSGNRFLSAVSSSAVLSSLAAHVQEIRGCHTLKTLSRLEWYCEASQVKPDSTRLGNAARSADLLYGAARSPTSRVVPAYEGTGEATSDSQAFSPLILRPLERQFFLAVRLMHNVHLSSHLLEKQRTNLCTTLRFERQSCWLLYWSAGPNRCSLAAATPFASSGSCQHFFVAWPLVFLVEGQWFWCTNSS